MVILLAGHAVSGTYNVYILFLARLTFNSVYVRGVIGFGVLVLSVILQSVASVPLMLLAWQLYITDTVAAEKRYRLVVSPAFVTHPCIFRAFFFSLLTGVQLGAVAAGQSPIKNPHSYAVY